jgi:hypothetical protein
VAVNRCRKRKYDSYAEAEAALNVIGPRIQDFDMRPYKCPACHFYHLGHDHGKGKTRALLRTQIADLQHKLSMLSDNGYRKSLKLKIAKLQKRLSEEERK